MRIARFEVAGVRGIGVVVEEAVYALPESESLLGVLTASAEARSSLLAVAQEREGHPLGPDLTLLAPVYPGAMRDFLNYEAQARDDGCVPKGPDMRREWHAEPRFVFMNPHAIVGERDEIEIPRGTRGVDFGLKVAAVVSRDAQSVPVEEASTHIGGYLIVNDWSAPELVREEMRLHYGPAKSRDFATSIGPWVVTCDELDAYRRDGRLHLELSVHVNRVPVGTGQLDGLSWSFEQMLAHASEGAWVRAGDLLVAEASVTGTLSKTEKSPCALGHGVLGPGDVVTLFVEGLGSLTNRVIAADHHPEPAP